MASASTRPPSAVSDASAGPVVAVPETCATGATAVVSGGVADDDDAYATGAAEARS